MIGNVRKYLQESINGKKISKYYITTKYICKEEQQQHINWRSLEQALNKQTPTKCGEVEVPCHYLRCNHPTMLTKYLSTTDEEALHPTRNTNSNR